jgi:hypothetical protein
MSLLSIVYAKATDRKDLIMTPEDEQIVKEKLARFRPMADLPIGTLIVEVGKSFLGTPYVAATLENGAEEKMVINLRELDCTTFAENCLALARTIKKKKTDFESFVSELEYIRYRDGIRNGYPSRLHYLSEWIHNNSAKHIVDESTNREGVKLDKTINFMSSNPQLYPVLKSHPELIPAIKKQEEHLTATPFYYFPKADRENLHKHLQNGDIIGLATGMEGIDVAHTGIIIRQADGQFKLLHASMSGKKVLISEGPIDDFIKPESKNSGIIIARPVF